MNSKQLTNILVKIVGLDVCAHALPNLCVLVWFQFENIFRGVGYQPTISVNLPASSLAMPLFSVATGVFLIRASRTLANWLFNDEPQGQ